MLSIVALAVVVAAPARSPSHQQLHTHCLMWAAQPNNPWALSHGITAHGATYLARDGRKASEVIIHDFLLHSSKPSETTYGFERYAADGTPIEPHTNLNAKTLVLAGLPLSTEFGTRFGKVTLQGLVAGVERGFHHVPTSEEYWRDVGWTLDLLAATRRPGKAAIFANGMGEKIDLNVVMNDALDYLERTEADLAQGLDRGLPQVDKRKQGIYAHPCGGLHLVQALGSWARYPEVRSRWGPRWEKVIAVLFYRLTSERRQYEAALQQVAQKPPLRLLVLTQMVKFYGHFLETAGRFKSEAGFVPAAAQKQQIETAKALLDTAVRELQAVKAFESMEAIKASQPQVYLDLIGDSCHATHGWDYWR